MHLRHLCWDICWESPVTHHHYMGASENCFTAMHVSANENTEAAGLWSHMPHPADPQGCKYHKKGNDWRSLLFESLGFWNMGKSCSLFLLKRSWTLETELPLDCLGVAKGGALYFVLIEPLSLIMISHFFARLSQAQGTTVQLITKKNNVGTFALSSSHSTIAYLYIESGGNIYRTAVPYRQMFASPASPTCS